MSNQFIDKLKGGDLRSIGESNKIVKQIRDQQTFDELFACISYNDRIVAGRSADAIEKITIPHPEYLIPHKTSLLKLLNLAKDNELKWHLALLVSRLELTKQEIGKVWQTLTNWALDKRESRIVRVNSIQGLYNLLKKHSALQNDFEQTIQELKKQDIPSVTARIKKLI